MSRQKLPRTAAAISMITILVSALQCWFLASDDHWNTYRIIATCLAIGNLFVATTFLVSRSGSFLGPTILLYCAQLVFFVVQITGPEPSPSPRLLQVTLVLLHLGIVLAFLLAKLRIVTVRRAILLSFSLAGGIYICEIVLQVLDQSPRGNVWLSPQWSGGGMQPHPDLGAVYRPGSIVKTYYPDNPRDYFKKEEDARQRMWRLRITPGNDARLVLPPNDPDLVRVDIENALSETDSDIQLNLPTLRVQTNHSYSITFRARAESPRSMILGFARAHAPWTGLGLYKEIQLSTEWREYKEDLVAIDDDDNARIHFDLGSSKVAVEFSSVVLRSVTDMKSIAPAAVQRIYFVDYRFNSTGCRGRDYQIPRPDGTERILLLGDSYTLGVGVHEEDTFAQQMERMLNANRQAFGPGKIYEVINCGVSGYGTRQERLFYELFTKKYQPQVVVLTMTWNDDMSFLEEEKKGYINRRPGKLEFLFYTWGKIQDYRYRRPFPSYSKCVFEISQLDRDVRKVGAHLVVVIFRNDSDFDGSSNVGKTWNNLTRTVTAGLDGTGIPIVDLGRTLYAKYSDQDLVVHPIDDHPNEIAHAIAAQEILNVVKKKKLLSP